MTASGFRVRVIGLVFVFKSASLVLKQVPTCIRKPTTNAFDKSIKFLRWLFLAVLDGFRSFQMELGHFRWFQVILGRFRSFQVVPHFNKYRINFITICKKILEIRQDTRQISALYMGKIYIIMQPQKLTRHAIQTQSGNELNQHKIHMKSTSLIIQCIVKVTSVTPSAFKYVR